MTANQTAYAAILALDEASAHRRDHVRARTDGSQPVTTAQSAHTTSPRDAHTGSAHHGLYLLPAGSGTARRGLHPGDIIYWVACLGGACLLLLFATT